MEHSILGYCMYWIMKCMLLKVWICFRWSLVSTPEHVWWHQLPWRYELWSERQQEETWRQADEWQSLVISQVTSTAFCCSGHFLCLRAGRHMHVQRSKNLCYCTVNLFTPAASCGQFQQACCKVSSKRFDFHLIPLCCYHRGFNGCVWYLILDSLHSPAFRVSSLRMAAAYHSKIFVPTYQTPRCHIPEDSSLHIHFCENFTSHNQYLIWAQTIKQYFCLRVINVCYWMKVPIFNVYSQLT